MTPDNQACYQELERMLESREFARAHQLRRLLEWLCRRKLSGTPQTFSEYEVGIGALQRKKDFNPHEDSVVRKEMARLRQRLARYYDEEGRHNPCRLILDRGSYEPRWVASDPAQSVDPGGAVRVLVLPFEAIGINHDSGFTESLNVALMHLLAVAPNVEVAPRFVALLHRQNPHATTSYVFDVIVEGVLERERDVLRAQSWLVRGQRAFLRSAASSAGSIQELAAGLASQLIRHITETV